MAERFMECVKTKTRGCVGEEVRKQRNFRKDSFGFFVILVCTWISFGIN
jgi:hypothetical protein